MPLQKLPRTMLTLEKRAAALRTLLTQNASEYKLIKAAERVRDARVQVLRATIGDLLAAQLAQHDRDARVQVLRATIGDMPSVIRTPQQNRRIAKLGGQIESLRATTPTAILAEFRLARQKASDDS
jgi:hypothetical protein